MGKKKFRASRAFTLPIAPIVGIIGMPGVRYAVDKAMSGDFKGMLDGLGQIIGLWSNGTWHFETLLENVIPPVVGILVHKLIGGKLGVNRALASARVPVLRL